RSLKLDVAEPASDDGHIDTGGNKLNRCRAPEDMRRDSLLRESRNMRCRRVDILTQTESKARCRQRLAVSIDEQRFAVWARATPQECDDNFGCFRPKRRDPLFSPFSKETNMTGRLQTNVLRAEIKRLLDARSGVVEQRNQRVIALSFSRSAVGL